MQRQLAIRVIAGYRTVAYEVAILLARTPPWILVARKCYRTYEKIKQRKKDKSWSKDIEEDIKAEEELDMQKVWERRIRKEDLPGPKLRAAIRKNYDAWMSRKHGGMNYHLTQLLTGHGCFNSYFQRMKKVESALCRYCGRYVDNAEHTWTICEEWNGERDTLKAAINGPIDMGRIVEAICTKDTWQAVNTFARDVMSRKEEDEQLEKQRKRQEAKAGRDRRTGETIGGPRQRIDWEMEDGFDPEEETDEERDQVQDPGS